MRNMRTTSPVALSLAAATRGSGLEKRRCKRKEPLQIFLIDRPAYPHGKPANPLRQIAALRGLTSLFGMGRGGTLAKGKELVGVWKILQ